MSWKYVIMKVGNTEVPVIFPSRLVHCLIAENIKDYFVDEARTVTRGLDLPKGSTKKLRDEIVPVSAGDLELRVLSANGSSETLGIGARPNDKDAINAHPYTGGYISE